MSFKLFQFLKTQGIGTAMLFALWACSGGAGGLQQLDATAPSLDTPVTSQNQMGPPERPPVSVDIDPQGGIDLAELRETCQPFLDANNKSEAPQKCQDYWDFLKNNSTVGPGKICIVGSTCPQGQLHTLEPQPEIVTQPVVQQIIVPTQEGEGTTHQYIKTYDRPIPEGVILYRADDDDE